LETGVKERRQTTSIARALRWIKEKPLATVYVRCAFNFGENEGTFDSQDAAIHFLKSNWADFRLFLEEEVC